MDYRPDIDVLRAIAVLAVVLFHLDLAGFQGGYVGVDVFFVISGYLITSIIKHKHDHQNFKLSQFYARRIRRLLPPLIATIAATLLAASFIVMPYNMVELGRSAAAALFSLSNIVFYMEAGYWDSASELKPLLHTWSLGVEEQFYLFWPALVVGLLALRSRIPFGFSLVLITLFGAALHVWYATIDESAAFYLLPFRVFQFSMGAMLLPLAAAAGRHAGQIPAWAPGVALWAGLACIAASVTLFGERTVAPDWRILLATLGAALFLLSGALPGGVDSPGRVLTHSPLGQWLGRVSYSMYLVHWPIIALFRYENGLELEAVDQCVLALATLLATCALHYGIERRFYRRHTGVLAQSVGASDGRFALRTLFVAFVLASIASSAWLGDGWTWRIPPLTVSSEQRQVGQRLWLDRNKYACALQDFDSNPKCRKDAAIQVLFVGDSHRVDAYNFIHATYGDAENVNLVIFKYPAECRKRLQADELGSLVAGNEECQLLLDKLLDKATVSRFDVLVYAVRLPYTGRKYLSMIRHLKEVNPGMQVVTFGGYIQTKRTCYYYVNRTRRTEACADPDHVSYFAGEEPSNRLAADYRNYEALYIDRVELLCRNRTLETCRSRTPEGVPMLYDSDHNTVEFAEMSGRMYAKNNPDFLEKLADN